MAARARVFEPPGKVRYKRIEEKIWPLTRSNIEQETKEILEILEEGNIIYAKYEPYESSIMALLVGKTNGLYLEPSFATLVRTLHPSYKASALAWKEDLAYMVFWQLRYGRTDWREEKGEIWITGNSIARELIAKLKIWTPFGQELCTEILEWYIYLCVIDKEWNSHFVGVLTFLIKEGADPFYPLRYTRSAFSMFLEKFSSHLSDSLMPSVSTFLEEAFKKWEVSENKESILYDIIEDLPIEIIRGDSIHLSSLKELILRNCLEIIKTNPHLCDYAGIEGKTPLHKLMEKILKDDLWKEMPGLVAGTDTIWDLMSGLITNKNVNIKGKDKVTSYSWILWWQNSVTDLQTFDADKNEKLAKKIQDMKKQFLVKGASEEDALQGQKSIRYIWINKRISELYRHNIEQKTKEILAILEGGDICHPTHKSTSLIKELLLKRELYSHPSFLELIKALDHSYEASTLAGTQDLTEIVWEIIRKVKLNYRSKRTVIGRLQVFLPLKASLSTGILQNYIDDCDVKEDWNLYFLELLTFLVTKGADPFDPLGKPTSAFAAFLEKFMSHLSDSLMNPVSTFIEEAFKKWEVSGARENILNCVIKDVPSNIIEGSGRLSTIKELILRNCAKIIETNTELCDHEDEEGKTPLHWLMEKVIYDGSWKNIPELVSGDDKLWDLMSQLITEKNVNVKEKREITPFTWILWWQKSATNFQALDEQKKQILAMKIEEIMKNFQDKGACEEDAYRALEAKIMASPHVRVDEKIEHLTRADIVQETGEILEILDKETIIYPKQGPSIFQKLVEKTADLHEEPSFHKLLKTLYLNYKTSELSRKESLIEMVFQQLRYRVDNLSGAKQLIKIDSEAKAEEFMEKLKIFMSLENKLSTRFLWRLMKSCKFPEEGNPHFVHMLTTLIKEEADPFQTIEGTQSLTLFLKAFHSDLTGSVLPQVSTFLEEVFKIQEVGREDILNVIIKAVPNNIFQFNSSSPASMKELVVGNCLEIIEKNPLLCNHVDGEGRTPLHNLMETIDDSWEKNPEMIGGTDTLWKLMSHFISDKNVNMEDEDQVTPYSWILLWKESLALQNEPPRSGLAIKIEELTKCFQEKGVNEDSAFQGIKSLRERRMERLLRKLINVHQYLDVHLEGITEIEIDLEKIRDLKVKEKISKQLTWSNDFQDFAEEHIKICYGKVLAISDNILKVFINEYNAQEIYDVFIEHIQMTTNFHALLNLLEQCVEKGARPTIDHIYEMSIMMVVGCSTSEALLATVQMTNMLVEAYRTFEGKKRLNLYLNPIQEQWVVKDDLRTAASSAVRTAYGTLDNCMKSRSVINTLLFMREGDHDEDSIKKCFKSTNGILKKSSINALKWVESLQRQQHTTAEEQEKLKEKLKSTLIKRNDNWLGRNLLHLAAIFCHDGVLNMFPTELIKRQIDETDIHGCTPLHLAHLHGNLTAIRFLESHNAKVFEDYYGRFPTSDAVVNQQSEKEYKERCSNIINRKFSVFDSMKQMLVLPAEESEAIKNDLKKLFERMLKHDGVLSAKIEMGGSVREKLKVGRFNEFDLLVHIKSNPYEDLPFACLRLHAYFVKRLTVINMIGISLRCVGVRNPWMFIWEGDGNCHGLPISVDVVPILVEDSNAEEHERQGLILRNKKNHPNVHYLKWNDFEHDTNWKKTVYQLEWDILDNLTPGCRLGILIAKALLEAQDQVGDKDTEQTKLITSYRIKNTVFWILAGKSPCSVEEFHGNVVLQRFTALQNVLQFTGNNPRWTTFEDLEKYAEDGRFWAEKIFDAIHFMAEKYEMIFGSFLEDVYKSSSRMLNKHEVIDILHTCKTCLERLRPEVFYSERATPLSDAVECDSTLRTRWQKTIDSLEANFPDLLKYRKEVEQKMVKIKQNQQEEESKKQEILLEHATEIATELSREIDAVTEMDNDILKGLEELGNANQKESELFRLLGECEEAKRTGGRHSPDLRIKERECEKLEREIRELRSQSRRLLEKLEKMGNTSQAEASPDDGHLVAGPVKESPDEKAIVNPLNGEQLGKRHMQHEEGCEMTAKKTKKETNEASDDMVYIKHEEDPLKRDLAHLENDSDVSVERDKRKKIKQEVLSDQDISAYDGNLEVQQLPGYDPNDALRGGELAITTLDRFVLLCGISTEHTPTALHLQVMSQDSTTSRVTPSPYLPAIHYINNHYVVSCQRNGRIVLYDSLHNSQRVQQVLPQLKYLYQGVSDDASNVEYSVPQSQGTTSDCGLFAAANATMLIHGIDPKYVTLDTQQLRSHLHHCLQTGQVNMFPEVPIIL